MGYEVPDFFPALDIQIIDGVPTIQGAGFGQGQTSPGSHDMSPLLTKTQTRALVAAAETSQAAMEDWIETNHSSLWTFYSSLTSTKKAAFHLGWSSIRDWVTTP